jgi:hypothetical protein
METQIQILEYLKGRDFGASSTDISKHLGKSRITVAKNLEVMRARGMIDFKRIGMAKLWYLPSGRANIQSTVAQTDARDEKEAADSLAKDIKRQIDEPSFILIFSSTHIDPQKFFKYFTKKFPEKTKLIGCSTCGEISGYGIKEDTIVAMAIRSEHISVGVGIGKNLKKDGFKAGSAAAEMALNDLEHDFSRTISSGTTVGDILRLNLFFAFVFPDFMSQQEENALSGIFSIFGNRCPILGGGSGDNLKYKQTYQFYNGEVYTDSILVALFALDCKTDSISAHGWYPTEKSAFVTKARGRTVYELDHKRASAVYAAMIGMPEEELIKKRSIAVVENAGSKYVLSISDLHGNTWLKHPNKVYADGSITFFANVPENVVVSLNEATPASVIEATDSALKEVKKRLKPKICVIFYAIGRKKFLEGHRGCEDKSCVDEEFKIIKKHLSGVDFIGFYAFGQQGFTSSGVTGHRNQTVNFFFISDELLAKGHI